MNDVIDNVVYHADNVICVVDDDNSSAPVSGSFGCFSRSLVFDRALLAVRSVVVKRAGVDVTDERHILFVTLLAMLYNATFAMISIAPLNCASIVAYLKWNHGAKQAAALTVRSWKEDETPLFLAGDFVTFSAGIEAVCITFTLKESVRPAGRSIEGDVDTVPDIHWFSTCLTLIFQWVHPVPASAVCLSQQFRALPPHRRSSLSSR